MYTGAVTPESCGDKFEKLTKTGSLSFSTLEYLPPFSFINGYYTFLAESARE